MATGNRIIDISEDSVAVRRRRRHAVLRIGVPILGIVLVIVAIFGIAIYEHTANRRGVLALSNEFLDTLDAQIAQRVAAFLTPCERSLRLMRAAMNMPLTEPREARLRLALSVLRELPQVAAFYIGDSAGDFLMARRHADGMEIKQIIQDAAHRSVTLTELNAAGVETARREDPADTYDPRTRPWFKGALNATDVFWTGIYIFYTDRKPGITVSTRVPNAGGQDRVLGADVTLEELSNFLASLKIGTHGRALIMDAEGRLIAAPNSEASIKQKGDEFVPPTIDELNDKVLTAAFDRFRVEGKGRRIIELDGVRYISSVTPMPGSARNWWILMVVPEDDFIGFVTSNNRTALVMSLSIVLAVIVLAILLFRQGLRADRSVRLMAKRGQLMSQQSAAYVALADRIAEKADEAPEALTEALVTVTGARRASVWILTVRNQALRCLDAYDRDSKGHAAGVELHRRELPAFFELLEGGQELSIGDAMGDRRSSQFYAIVMRPLGSRALTVIPLHHGTQIVGAICLEDPGSLEGTKECLRTLASMYSAILPASPGAEQPPTPATAAREAPPPSSIAPISPADLGPSPADHANLRAAYFPEVAVMVLTLSGSMELARKSGRGDAGMAAQITELLQEMAAEHGVTYLKFVGQEAVSAAGFEQSDDEAMTRVAGVAIAVRDRLTHLFESGRHGAEFRIGLGFGGAYGCLLGRERQQFNLWGDAFETADIMAHSAAPGAIQATEAAYVRLRQDFLFRPRGTFYLPRLGQSHTFVLAGQL